jgi:hypothetical protein
MAPCTGKPKCGCGCPKKKKKVGKRKAPGSSKAGKKAPVQRGSAVIPTFPGSILQQEQSSFLTPVPSAVSKITGYGKKTAEIGTQTEPIQTEAVPFKKETVKKLNEKLNELLTTPTTKAEKAPKTKRNIKEGILEPDRGFSVVRRARSVSRPATKATNVPGFLTAYEARNPTTTQYVTPEDIKPRTIRIRKKKVEIQEPPVGEEKPMKADDIQPKRRGRPPTRSEIIPGVPGLTLSINA